VSDYQSKCDEKILTVIASLITSSLMGCAQAQTLVQVTTGQQPQVIAPNKASRGVASVMDPNRPSLPSCTEAQKNYRALAGELPKDYPAVHFDKEQLVKTIVGIANNPNIDREELARIFGLKFVACSEPAYVPDGEAPRKNIYHISDGGFPLKAMGKDSGMSVYYVYFSTPIIAADNSPSIELNFDFNETKANRITKLDRYNCVADVDFSEHLKNDWSLSAYYGHAGFKHYRRTIDKYQIQFTARPFRDPDLKPDPRLPFPPSPLCITSISLLIQPSK
jgi:hypothetical protein